MEIKTSKTTKGTRILIGQLAEKKYQMIHKMGEVAIRQGYERIIMPNMQFQDTFSGKVGNENQKMMYSFQDAGGRDLCLAPEYTAVVQDIALNYSKFRKDLKIFYAQECFRAEKPQAGRYRQFTQFGVEILNPTKDYKKQLLSLAQTLISNSMLPMTVKWFDEYLKNLVVNEDVTRGLDYYKEGQGFEISYSTLGAQKQICGGGAYDGGIGFAIGVDRLLLIK